MLPQNFSKSKSTEGGPTDKDGFEGPPFGVLNYVIEVALNGFFVTVVFDDPETPDLRYVVTTMDEVIHIMRGNF